jgi:hypothetical protein
LPASRCRSAVAEVPSDGASARRKGGLKPVREGVGRIDVELPRVPGERRRRVSRTIVGSREEAAAAKTVSASGLSTHSMPQWTLSKRSQLRRLGKNLTFKSIKVHVDEIHGENTSVPRGVDGDRHDGLLFGACPAGPRL